MTINLDLKDAALIIQSIEATDWAYCGEGDRGMRIGHEGRPVHR